MNRLDCECLLSKLDDLVDGKLGEAEAVAVRLHLDACAHCQSELDRLHELLAATRSLPRSVEPDRDLWPGIEAAIASRRVARDGFGRPLVRRLWLAAAAAAVLAAAVTLAYRAGLERSGPRLAEGPPVSTVTEAAYDGVSSDLRRARDQLRDSLDQRRQELSPETWAVVMDNMTVIDDAIARIETALEDNPNNDWLNRQLALAYLRQIDLLQRATRLPAEA